MEYRQPRRTSARHISSAWACCFGTSRAALSICASSAFSGYFFALLVAAKPALSWRRETTAVALLAIGGIAFTYWALLCTNREINAMIATARSRLLAQSAPLLVLLAGQLILPSVSSDRAASEVARRWAANFVPGGLATCIMFRVL